MTGEWIIANLLWHNAMGSMSVASAELIQPARHTMRVIAAAG